MVELITEATSLWSRDSLRIDQPEPQRFISDGETGTCRWLLLWPEEMLYSAASLTSTHLVTGVLFEELGNLENFDCSDIRIISAISALVQVDFTHKRTYSHLHYRET